jgi:hypothetical protein
MTNKDLVTLADTLRINNRTANAATEFTPDHLRVLADFFASQDASFKRERWMDYITGEWEPGIEPIFVDCDKTLGAGATWSRNPSRSEPR